MSSSTPSVEPLFITGAHHRAVCAQYEVRLAAAAERVALAEQHAQAAEEERRTLSLRMLEALIPEKKTGPVATATRKHLEHTQKVQVPLDPYDMPALVRQAYRETGNRNPRAIMARVQRMQDNMLAGKQELRPRSIPVPDEVARMIEEAERKGEQAALAEAQAS